MHAQKWLGIPAVACVRQERVTTDSEAMRYSFSERIAHPESPPGICDDSAQQKGCRQAPRPTGLFRALLCLTVSAVITASLAAQESASESVELQPRDADAPLAPPQRIDVQPAARDPEISTRLSRILAATGWFSDPVVEVTEGVVFLAGSTEDAEYRIWAGDLARNTEGVVAVVNKIEVTAGSPWDFSDVDRELSNLGLATVRALPFIFLAILVLLLAWGLARLAHSALQTALRPRISSSLLRAVAARALSFVIFLLGLYFVLRVSGLTRLAVSVIGGTGIVGLVLGIAFRDITENFLASLFLSLQQPFRTGDLIEVAATTGYVQRLTSRTTVLMTLDGNQVQIPNATIFKSTIRNFTSNPNRRDDFTIGIGYNDLISDAQDVALKVLSEHPTVLKDPEPWVLVDSLGPSTVNLRVYFWLDGAQHSWIKVRSSVIRLMKRAFQDAGISLPDEAREIVFPDGVPLRQLDSTGAVPPQHREARSRPAVPEAVSTQAEGSLRTEADDLSKQAEHAWAPDGGENLLEPLPAAPSK